jgi:hypothetical protein
MAQVRRVLALPLMAVCLLAPGVAAARSAPPRDDEEPLPLNTSDDPIENQATPPTTTTRPMPIAAEPPPPAPWRLEGGMGWRIGSQLVDGHSTGTVNALHLEAGMRDGRLLLAAEYQLSELQLADAAFTGTARAGDGTPIYSGDGCGLMHRFGANAKYSFARESESDGGFDFYAEGGIGVEHVRWDAGGVLNRPDISLGVGAAMYGQSARRHGGTSIGLRVTLAKRDDVDHAANACGGPCDYATPPTGIDRSFMFDITIMFGK